jgi:hypothetical protein
MNKCELCKGTLVAISAQRKNGKILQDPKGRVVNDWENRKYHKKCWKKLQEKLELEEKLRRYSPEVFIQKCDKCGFESSDKNIFNHHRVSIRHMKTSTYLLGDD